MINSLIFFHITPVRTLSKTFKINVNSMDMQAGLDSWMGDIDKDMLKYYQKSLGKKVDL